MASTAIPSDPSPALPLSGKDVPIAHDMLPSIDTRPNGLRRTLKEVHFSPPSASPLQRANSLATTVPLQEPISSASSLPRRSQRTAPGTLQHDVGAFFEQSRALLETQRDNFERERATFEAERKLWEAERRMLLSRIADLEFKNRMKAKSTVKRRYSNETPSRSFQSFQSDSSFASKFRDMARGPPSTNNVAHPVWETPDMGQAVTRVFSDESNNSKRGEPTLPKISELGSLPSFDGALSPGSKPIDLTHAAHVSIPIEMLDSRLDGITLKATALPPSLVAKVISPNSSSPHTPSPQTKTPNDSKLTIEVNNELIPEAPHLKTNAGHTPLAFDGPLEASRQPSDVSTPVRRLPEPESKAERPVRPPTERSDSYFPDASPPKPEDVDLSGAKEPPATHGDEDSELKGPLTMDSEHEEGAESEFLKELDARLLMEAKRVIGPSHKTDGTEDAQVEALAGEDDEPRLKLKKSTNFGSAFGASDCGHFR